MSTLSYNPPNPHRDGLKLLLLIIALVCAMAWLSGCSPQKQLAKLQFKHPELFKTKTKDSISTKIIKIPHDSLIIIPGKEVQIHDTIPCPGLDYFKSESDSGITAYVSIKNNKLSVDCKEDSLKKVITTLETTILTMRTHTISTYIPGPVTNEIPFFYKFCTWLLILIAAGLAIWKLGPSALKLLAKISWKSIWPF